MGRAGAGGGGGHRSSGGHSAGGHSGSGHRVGGGGHRAGSGGGFGAGMGGVGGYNRGPGFSRGPGGGSMPPPGMGGFGGPRMTPPPPNRNYRGYGGGGCFGSAGGCLGTFLSAIMLIIFLSVFFGSISYHNSPGASSITRSTYNREKAETGMSFDYECIVDEIGWFDNTSQAGKALRTFYNKTGVQPYVVFRAYDPALTTDDEKAAYAEEYYNSQIGNEGTFLFMYFAEEDTDNDVGYMYCVAGNLIASVMDSEAQDVFWDYVDTYWYSDLSTDDMVEEIFTHTADRIMTKTITSKDITVIIIIALVVICLAVVGYKALKAKFKRDKEKAEEDERILNSKVHTYGSSEDDDLLNKYK